MNFEEKPPMAGGNVSSDDDSENWERPPSPELGRISPDIFEKHDGAERDRALDLDEAIAIGPHHNMRYAADIHVEAAMAKMDPAEREKIYFDVHGISSLPVETPELARSSLREFQAAIDDLLLAAKRKSNAARRDEVGLGLRGIFSTGAYELALARDPAYVEDPELRLAFLRREKFADPIAAARRFVQWFSVKLDLFGPDLLTETITQDVLASFEEDGPDPVGCLTDGFKQVLPLRDNAGRLVFCDLVSNSCYDTSHSTKIKLRRKFYMSMVAAEDPETQLKGAVMVWYAVAAKDLAPLDDWNYVRALFAVMDCVPLRIEAIHSCHNSHWDYAAKVAVFRLMCGIFLSARTRVHVGPHHKCLFVLQTYGVPVTVMPLSADGSFEPTKDRNALLWVQRREYEQRHLSRRKGGKVTPPEDHEQEKEATGNQEPDPKDKELDLTDEDIKSLLSDGESGIAFNSADGENNPNENSATSDSQEANVVVETHAGPTARDVPAAILLPGQYDVLLGRGAGYHCHAGNVRLRGMIGPKVDAHAACSTTEDKVRMTLDIVQEVQAQGGRFLKQGDTGWAEVSDQEARQKVGHTFRNMRPAAMRNDTRKKVAKRVRPEAA